jgi:hypothetical protein
VPTSSGYSTGSSRSSSAALRRSSRDGSIDPRHAVSRGPLPGEAGWLGLSDDELVFRIESLPADHAKDEHLLEVVRSSRHFFIRQEAAKRVREPERLKAFEGDRHIGQILVRQMRRESDVEYLERLVRESRHLEVRNAAKAQLKLLREALKRT